MNQSSADYSTAMLSYIPMAVAKHSKNLGAVRYYTKLSLTDAILKNNFSFHKICQQDLGVYESSSPVVA